jgi:hypothetical protein
MALTARTTLAVLLGLTSACREPEPAGAAPPSADGGATVAVDWSFPALIPDANRGLVFPTYLAHLLGRPLDHPFPTDLVCADIVNPGPPFSGTVTVKLAVYGEDATQSLTAATGRTHVCVTPTFDLAKLYSLRAATPARLEATLATGGEVISATMEPVSVSPVDEIAWRDGQIPFRDLRLLAGVFVTPGDPKIDQLQRVAASASVFGRFGNGPDAYERAPYPRTAALGPGEMTSETVVVEKGEPIAWALPSVSGGGAVDVDLFTAEQFSAWRAGTANEATAVWAAQGSGASGRAAVPANVYILVVLNAGADPLSVTWGRNVTREDVAADTLRAIYTALQALQTKYSSISDSSFFDGFQRVRRPSETLDALSANCLDGALLFASVLELVGMKPILVFRTGHVYAAVRSAPGSNVIWPVETTMVGTDDFPEAFAKAIDELVDDSEHDPQFQLLDVAAARTRGVLPLAE